MSNVEKKQISRKDFIKGVGVSLAGVAMAGSLGGLLTACTNTGAASVNTASSTERPAWPYEYKKLDVEKVKERAYNAYKEKGGWGIGVSEGFFGSLADEVGYPINQIPPEAFTSFAGGFGQASLCGTLAVGATCIGMVTDVDTQKELVGELFNWYKGQNFPEYQPENLNLTQTVADSVLCHDSVGKFMEVSGVAYGDPERKSRCAGVAAEVAGKVAELLNAHFA